MRRVALENLRLVTLLTALALTLTVNPLAVELFFGFLIANKNFTVLAYLFFLKSVEFYYCSLIILLFLNFSVCIPALYQLHRFNSSHLIHKRQTTKAKIDRMFFAIYLFLLSSLLYCIPFVINLLHVMTIGIKGGVRGFDMFDEYTYLLVDHQFLLLIFASVNVVSSISIWLAATFTQWFDEKYRNRFMPLIDIVWYFGALFSVISALFLLQADEQFRGVKQRLAMAFEAADSIKQYCFLKDLHQCTSDFSFPIDEIEFDIAIFMYGAPFARNVDSFPFLLSRIYNKARALHANTDDYYLKESTNRIIKTIDDASESLKTKPAPIYFENYAEFKNFVHKEVLIYTAVIFLIGIRMTKSILELLKNAR